MKKQLAILLFLLLLAVGTSVGAQEPGVIYKLKEGAVLPAMLLEEGEAPRSIGNQCYVTQEGELLDYLRANDLLEYEEPDGIAELFDAPNDPYYVQQWNLEMVHFQTAWDAAAYGGEVVVAVIDSGLFSGLGDLDYDRVLEGVNLLDGTTNTEASYYHGTFVTSVMLARSNNGAGMTGASHHVRVIPFKCFESRTTDASNMIAALNAAVDDPRVDIINMSCGTQSDYTAMQDAVQRALDRGIIIVAAAGNSGFGESDPSKNNRYPAAYSPMYANVISVGSVDADGSLSSFSQRVPSVLLLAPGASIYGLGQNGIMSSSGTSFSAPLVTSAVAVAKRIAPQLSIYEIRALLLETLAPLRADVQPLVGSGSGVLDMGALIERVMEETPVYVSDIIMTDNLTTKVQIRNNQSTPQTVVSVWQTHRNGSLRDRSMQSLEIPAMDMREVEYETGFRHISQFTWTSLTGMQPLSPHLVVDSGWE